MFTQHIPTPAGSFEAHWNDDGKLRSCSLKRNLSPPKSIRSEMEHDLAGLLRDTIESYFETGALTWEIELLDWSGATPG